MFYVGQKVVCVDAVSGMQYMPAGTPILSFDLNGLQEGAVYTVRLLGRTFGHESIWLEEIVRPFCPRSGREAAFAAERFRPVVERKTDISIFKAMLNPSGKRVDV